MVNERVLEEKRWDYDSREQGLTGDAREIRGERMSEGDRIYVIITRILVKGTLMDPSWRSLVVMVGNAVIVRLYFD